MASPSSEPAAAELWQGGLTAAGPPPGLPDLSSGGITVVAQQSATAVTGALVCYQGGAFTRQFWTTGPPVPLLVGTVLGSASGISAQTHLASVPAGNPAPLREADLRSLALALEDATQPIDPLRQQMLSLVQDALP